jgi:hypothetical protein
MNVSSIISEKNHPDYSAVALWGYTETSWPKMRTWPISWDLERLGSPRGSSILIIGDPAHNGSIKKGPLSFIRVSLRRLSITSPHCISSDLEKYMILRSPRRIFILSRRRTAETCTFVMRAFSQSSVNICTGILMILPAHAGAEWKLCFLGACISRRRWNHSPNKNVLARGIFSASLRIHRARVEICFCYHPPRADSVKYVNGKCIFIRFEWCDGERHFFHLHALRRLNDFPALSVKITLWLATHLICIQATYCALRNTRDFLYILSINLWCCWWLKIYYLARAPLPH